jgi:hypothetical protein
MGNNAPDYYDNLAFAPTSADDLGEQKRDSDVLIKAIEKCEKLEKQLKIAKKGLTELKNYGDCNLDCEIAAKCLKQIKGLDK